MSNLLSEQMGALLFRITITLFAFSLPLSPTAKSFFFVSALCVVVVTPSFYQHIIRFFKTAWGLSASILFLFIVLSSFWSVAPLGAMVSLIGKYAKLLYLPLIAVGFMCEKTRQNTIDGYLAAIFLTCILSVMKLKGLWGEGDPGTLFYNHIVTGFMVAFGAYLALIQSMNTDWNTGTWLYRSLFLLMSAQVLFINTGRTGYIVYFFLMGLLLLQHIWKTKSLLSLLFFALASSFIIYQSPPLKNGLRLMLNDVYLYQNNQANTSLGFRLQFHEFAKGLFLEHPIVGNGLGSFSVIFHAKNPIPVWGPKLNDPHSQYWMTLSEQGIIGLIFLSLFLSSLVYAAMRLNEKRMVLLGFLLSFCLFSFSDTVLCYSPVGYMMVLFAALCLGEKRA